jgi:glycogen debranching enzyme
VSGTVILPRGSVHIYRSKFLLDNVCYERLNLRNYALSSVDVNLSLRFDGDYADIFEVRGQKRDRRGTLLEPVVETSSVVLGYEGLDRIIRRTRLECTPAPQLLTRSELALQLRLEPRKETSFLITITCTSDAAQPKTCTSYDCALTRAKDVIAHRQETACSVRSSNQQFNRWLNRSLADLQMMITETASGMYPYAGVPWFSTIFGRDGIITALEYLWVDPAVARGVLGHLAATQATESIPDQDAEPGKILHEARGGEMALMGEIPFRCYYGSVDATPLFVMLAAAYYQRAGDLDFLRSIWPNIELALQWIDSYGDSDGDGFVEYCRRTPNGLFHQGWKDSQDSVFHSDGTLADAPIALCEVQGYVYAAKRAIAEVASLLDLQQRAMDLRREADALRERFENAFWCEELATYAIALDGEKRQCRVRTSNAGHCLFTGIASRDRAERTAATLLSNDGFSGWGVRTVAATESRYNPMSYHNGSIWPHDNAMVAQGLARYGRKDMALKVLTGLYEAAMFSELNRLPELFCGFFRRSGKGPTAYPVACSPQAWAAAAAFMVLQACIGLQVDARKKQICFTRPVLPEVLSQLEIRNLRVNDAAVDVVLERYGGTVGLRVTRREGDVEVVMVT